MYMKKQFKNDSRRLLRSSATQGTVEEGTTRKKTISLEFLTKLNVAQK